MKLAESPSEHVSWDLVDDVWTITIDRPSARNALTTEMYEAIKRGIHVGSGLTEASLIVIRGTGGSFAAGGDLQTLLDLLNEGPVVFRAEFDRRHHEPLPWRAAIEATKPLVGVIDGYCLAGGLLLAMCCDITIATERSSFGIPEARVGIADKSTVELLVPSIGIQRAKYLAYTGRMIDGRTAEGWGLVSLCVEDKALDEAVDALIADLRRSSPTSLRAYKTMFGARIGTMPSDVLIDVALTPDGREGLEAFEEKRPPDWPSRSRGSTDG